MRRINKNLKGTLLMGLMAFLSACTGGPTLDHYKGSKPPLDLQEYFTAMKQTVREEPSAAYTDADAPEEPELPAASEDEEIPF